MVFQRLLTNETFTQRSTHPFESGFEICCLKWEDKEGVCVHPSIQARKVVKEGWMVGLMDEEMF